MVGAIGFEPTTPCAQGRCATRLRYAPTFTALRGVFGPFRILLQTSNGSKVRSRIVNGAALFSIVRIQVDSIHSWIDLQKDTGSRLAPMVIWSKRCHPSGFAPACIIFVQVCRSRVTPWSPM